ncbi:MAG: glycosyltransferase [Flavisolibacter sp.]
MVDDSSTNATKEILKSELAHVIHNMIFHEKNMGKGAALSSGFREAT